MATGDKRRYSEKEIGALIQRATEIQKGVPANDTNGLSIEEVGEIAAEFGIDEASLRAAALELDKPATEKGILGGPFSINMVRVLDGHFSDEEWEEAVEAIRRTTGSRGRSRHDGRARIWSREIKDMGSTLDQILVSIREKDQSTILEGRRGYTGLAFIGYMFSVMIGGVVAGIFLDGSGVSDIMSLLLVIAGVVGGMATFRFGLGLWVQKQKEKLNVLVDKVHATLGMSASLSVEEPQLVDGQLGDVMTMDDAVATDDLLDRHAIKRKVSG
ncbi:MAG: hypothetical protein AAF564_04580 [Bacteroidota bacterium]